jgi:hypothetical protein
MAATANRLINVRFITIFFRINAFTFDISISLWGTWRITESEGGGNTVAKPLFFS